MPAKAAFYYAQLAKQSRYEGFHDMLQAACFPEMDKKGSRSVVRDIAAVMNGPMRPVTWKQTLGVDPDTGVDIAEEVRNVEAEVAETVAKIRAAGIPFTGRVENPDNPFQQLVGTRFSTSED